MIEPNIKYPYGKNFTVRLKKEEREKLQENSIKVGIKPTTYVRKALAYYHDKILGEEECIRIYKADMDTLHHYITQVQTPQGKELLQKLMEINIQRKAIR